MRIKRIIYCLLGTILLLGCFSMDAYAQKGRENWLGGGGTNMSGNRWRLDRNGLRTGTTGFVHNLFGVYFNGGYSSYMNTIPNCQKMPNGYGVGGGICYEHQRGGLKFHLGVGVRYQDVTCSVNDTTFYDPTVKDAWGYPYTLRYDFYNRYDHTITWNVQAPILIGYNINGFYFLGGVNLNYAFTDKSYMTATGTTSGTYPQFLGQFFEMDNHGFRKNVDMERTGAKLRFKFDVMLSFEAGYEWSSEMRNKSPLGYMPNQPRYETRVRLAAFVEYGLINICPQQDNLLVDIPANYKWDFPEYKLNHVFTTDVAKPHDIHNFYAGIKLTLLMGSYQDKVCVLCPTGWKSESESSGKFKKK